jgi:alpha-aminoadipate/glutamate carrier protein LysW
MEKVDTGERELGGGRLMGECPVCGTGVTIPSGSRVNEVLGCETCQSELEILGLDPPELALSPEVEEDWGE